MKPRPFFPPTTLKVSFFAILVAVLLAPASRAGQTSNTYVTVKTDEGEVSLCEDEMSFHISPADGPVSVTVAANAPYILLSPNPPSSQISPHQIISWAVLSEDGEIKTAAGSIGFCSFFVADTDDQHDDNPKIKEPVSYKVAETTNLPYGGGEPRKFVKIEATAEEKEQGRHTIEIIYEPCPTCKTTAPKSEFVRFASFNTFQWEWKLVSGDKDMKLGATGNELKDAIPLDLLTTTAELFVHGFWTGCIHKKCKHTASFKIDPRTL